MSQLLLRRPALAWSTPLSQARRLTQTQPSRLLGSLAYDLHAPSKPRGDERTSPIIFLHGLFGSKKNNRGISKALARDLGLHVYALDLRNHGDSPHDTRHDYSAMAEDVSDFIHEHELQDSILIGHSMGAKTAMALALQSPRMVSKLVVVDNAPVSSNLGRVFATYIQGMKKIQAANATRQAEADKILEEFEDSLTIRQFLLGNLSRAPGEASLKFRIPLDILGRSLDHLGDFPFRDPEAIRYVKPTLFVRGTKSHYVPDDVMPVIGRFFPRFRMADIEAGHWLISEQPEEFRKVVVEFLRGPE